MAENLRSEDLQELKASSGRTPLVALKAALEGPSSCLVGCVDSIPVVIFGVQCCSSDVGAVWLLATDDIRNHRFAYLRLARDWLQLASMWFPRLVCISDDRNTVHQRLLKWAGFEAQRSLENYGVEHRPFTLYERTKYV